VIGVSSISASAGLIVFEKLDAIDVKKALNYWAISKELLKVMPSRIISEMVFFAPFVPFFCTLWYNIVINSLLLAGSESENLTMV
jgi:hypothetical protein